MKTRKLRTVLSTLLCLSLLVGTGASPARAVAPEEAPAALAEATPLEEESLPPESETGEAPPEASAESLPAALPQEEEAKPEAEPIIDGVTLRFRLGADTVTLTVPRGSLPEGVPEIPALAQAEILGWYNGAGKPVDPALLPAEEDATYTARWGRRVEELLNTDEHFAYIQGYGGLFRPEKGLTRAEAAQIFYTLLRDKSSPGGSFADVNGQWYAEAVEAMAGLGIIKGYADGLFRPERRITRAEFVTMAVACDALSEGAAPPFPDVAGSSWAAPAVATAAAKGWISGFSDGKFRPNDTVTRAQAVTVINKMLGRHIDAAAKKKSDVKNFYDVFPDSWAYGDIVEASTGHSYETGPDGSELWTAYEADAKQETGRWMEVDGKRFYLDGKTRKFLRGRQTINGKSYLLDAATGAAYSGYLIEGSYARFYQNGLPVNDEKYLIDGAGKLFTGWRTVDGWRRYYKNGVLLEDISGLGVVSGPYLLKVYKNSNYVIAFAKDSSGSYNTPVRAMLASCGYGTITGTYYTPAKYRWCPMFGGVYAQWCTQIQGNYLFHSVPNWTYSNMDLEVGEYNHLGDTRSMGCVRLSCKDAKWVFDNCSLGTRVDISSWETQGPLKKPEGIKLPSWHTWDPTDPTAYWRCQQLGCH